MAARGTPVVLMDPNTDLPYAAGGSGGGGGGGPATVADGADIAQGSRADAAYTDTTGAASSTLVGIVKGAFVLLEAWAKLSTEPELLGGAHLTLAGDRGTDRARALTADRGIAGSVDVRDWLSPPDAAELLAGADVFVLPSRSEGQPMAVLEAMAHGLCVVASDVGGIPEMLEDGRSGLLVPADDVDALAAVLARVLGDATLRGRLGTAARERVLADFDLDVVWRRFDALYTEAGR